MNHVETRSDKFPALPAFLIFIWIFLPDYVHSLRKPVSSQYAEGLFLQFMKDGSIYNLTARRDQLQEITERLSRKVSLYQQRLDWLTSGSRQLCGVIQERSTTLVLNFGSVSSSQYDLSRDAVCQVIREQVSQIARFNLICSSPDLKMWQEQAVQTSKANTDSAVEWIWTLEHKPATSQFSTAEALLKAMSDKTIEAVYLFAAGDFKENVSDLLRNKLVNSVCPIHTISFNAKNEETVKFLKALAHLTAGRFHAFAEMHASEVVSFDDGEEGDRTEYFPNMPKRPIGGVPPGAGVREDVFLIWREMEEARSTIAQIQAILLEYPQTAGYKGLGAPEMPQSEDSMSSKTWLAKYGLRAQKLSFYNALADCAFRHSDGVVDVKSKPAEESLQTDAEKRHKLVNAKYCDKFAHTKWKDGSVVHVYVTAEKCKWYEDRMKTALTNLQKRLQWLQNGSRELFGTILEDQVYVLIDTSESMKDQLPTLKQKIFQLMQEQLRHKAKVNFVKFDSRVAAWRDRLAEVNEQNLENAWYWVKGLQVGGSTNTLGALRLAIADVGTHAVYLLTDGRPDQPLKTVLAQVQLQPPVPIHTISFNCDDLEANTFLYELSRETGGRYHCYCCDISEPGAPPPFSEDIHLLKMEIEQGEKDLEKVLKLRAECVMLDWYHNGENQMVKRPQSAVERTVASHRNHRQQLHTHTPEPPKPHSLHTQKIRHAAHTKASLLRLQSNGVDISDKDSGLKEWMLPETLSVFKRNIDKKTCVLNELCLGRRVSLDMSSARWLKVNGLVARRLTLVDALAPTAIPQTAKYVPILDKHVYSKVFDEVLPLAHVSNSKRHLTLINPQAVNLDAYRKKLEHALKSYERRLNLIVWRALSQEERDKFGSEKPLPFGEHKEALLQALDRLGWPVAQEDVSLLEDEIDNAQSFLQQAEDLQKAVGKGKDQGKGSRPGSSQDGHTEETKDEKRNASKKRKALDSLRGQKVIARSDIDGFYYPGTVSKCLNSKRAIVDFSHGDTQIVPVGFLIPVGGSGPCPPLAVSDQIELQCFNTIKVRHFNIDHVIMLP
ncbi:VWA3B protein, partial [Amia calva]|nr:VWA3B protein [Amia calva]